MTNMADSHSIISKVKSQNKAYLYIQEKKYTCRISQKVGCDNMILGGSHNIIPEKFQFKWLSSL